MPTFFGFSLDPLKTEQETKAEYEQIERARSSRLPSEPRRIINKHFVETHLPVREAPVIIGSTDAIGTVRARAKHYEAYLDYFQEEQALKSAGAPVFPVFIR